MVTVANPHVAARVTVLALSVCVSVKSHLTSGVSVRSENTVTYSAGNGGQIFVGFFLKPLRCGDPAISPCTDGHFPEDSRACAL